MPTERPPLTDADIVSGVQKGITALDVLGTEIQTFGAIRQSTVLRAFALVQAIPYLFPRHPALGPEYGSQFAHDSAMFNSRVYQAARAQSLGRNQGEVFVFHSRHMLSSVLQEFGTTLATVDLTSIVEEVSRFMRLHRRTLTIDTNLDPDAQLARSQEDLLYRELFNIVNNGWKGVEARGRKEHPDPDDLHIPDGKIVIRSERVGDQVGVEVEDGCFGC